MTEYLLIRAAFKQETARTPIWFMRQAGRYLPQYQAVRKKAGNFLNLCRNPDYAVEVTLQPLEFYDLDAAIMFSDILTPLEGMGMELDFIPQPIFSNPLISKNDVERLKLPDPDENVPYVGSILRQLRETLSGKKPVIGFCGAPFTLASYMLEGGGSKNFVKAKSFFYYDTKAANLLMEKLSVMTIDYLNYQIENGADMVQMFDTWAGVWNEEDYRRYVLPYNQMIFSKINGQKRVPRVYYTQYGQHLLSSMADIGADMIGLDWRTPIAIAKEQIGHRVALQGNLDPCVLFASEDRIQQNVRDIIDGYGKNELGHVFNLGGGIDKDTDPEKTRIMVEEVKNYSRRQ